VAPNVEDGVEIPMDSRSLLPPGDEASIRVRMLGPLEIRRNGAPVPLPASRKVRGLFAYLALAPRGATRSQLCELLWDSPNDPRGELRWCLTKLRRLVDDADRARVLAQEDTIRLDLADCFVDAIEVGRATAGGVEALTTERTGALARLFDGDLLEGLEIDRSPAFAGWLTGQRRRFRNAQTALLEQLATRVPDEDTFAHVEKWLQLAPFDRRAHGILLTALARCGRIREAEKHLETAAKQFESEGLDFAAVRHAWRAARAAGNGELRVLTVEGALSVTPASDSGGVPSTPPRRASIAVMPFAEAVAAPRVPGGVGDALAHDVITRLAKLRSLFVIAQGSVFALKERSVGAEDAGRMLDVDYVVSGAVRHRGGRLAVTVELIETRTARVVWAEMFDEKLDDAFQVLDEIGNRIVASVAGEIEMLERNRAVLKPPSSLDAWEAHHRGLWHMYRFTRADNEQAQHFFSTALRLDPTFARPYAGLSFTHWQNAFQGWAEREPEIRRALEAAGRGLMADDRDPAAHWAQGRALWLQGRHDDSVVELEHAVDLSPNFAHGHYTLAFVQSQAGDPLAAISASDHSRHLSPFDPLLFGMLGARAMALVRLGRFEEAAASAVKAAARPNAHPHIFGIAAYSLALAGSLDEARAHAAAIRRTLPGYTVADFLQAFRFDADGEARFREGAKRIGMG
jgi:DNA-binding SARP family transcriptional activator/TolB-like protein